MNHERESVEVGRLDGGRMIIRYTRILKDGLDMSGDLIFDEANGPWLLEKMTLAAEDNLRDTDGDFHPDHFTVYVRGGDRGVPHNVNVLNSREGTGPLGNVCGFCIATPEVALDAIRQLRDLLEGV